MNEYEKIDQLTADIFEGLAPFECAEFFAVALSHAAAAILCQERGEVEKADDEWTFCAAWIDLFRCNATDALIDELTLRLALALKDAHPE